MITALYKDLAPPSSEITSVTIEDMRHEQKRHQPPLETMRDGEGICWEQQRIWISIEADSLKLRIPVEIYFGERGHRSFETILDIVNRVDQLPEMHQEIKAFTQACIHFIISQNGEHILRPFSTAGRGEKLNEVVHAYFLHMGLVEEHDLKYVLLIKDFVSSYTWLFPCASAEN